MLMNVNIRQHCVAPTNANYAFDIDVAETYVLGGLVNAPLDGFISTNRPMDNAKSYFKRLRPRQPDSTTSGSLQIWAKIVELRLF